MGYTTARALIRTDSHHAVRSSLVAYLVSSGLEPVADGVVAYQNCRFEIITRGGWTSIAAMTGANNVSWSSTARRLGSDFSAPSFSFWVSDSDVAQIRGFSSGRSIGRRLLAFSLPARPVPYGWRRFTAAGERMPWLFDSSGEYRFERVFNALGLGDLPYLFGSEHSDSHTVSTLVMRDPTLLSPEVDEGAPSANVRTFPLNTSVGQSFEHVGFAITSHGGAINSVTFEFAPSHAADLIRVDTVAVSGISPRLPRSEGRVVDRSVTIPAHVLPTMVSSGADMSLKQTMSLKVAEMEGATLMVTLAGESILAGSGPVSALLRLEGNGTYERRLWLPVDAASST
jgi:hypothetical protein